MLKAKLWSGEDLKGTWSITLKLDGVRVLFTEEGPVSRKGKPLYNIPTNHSIKDAEVFTGSFKDTISSVKTKVSSCVPIGCLYSLDPLDHRLFIESKENPTKEYLNLLLTKVVAQGHEGLILRQGNTWLKVKPEETFDVTVTYQVEGTGKHKGKLGALMTPMGKVGTGFTDAERQEFWGVPLVGETIEVSCMQLTENGKFRHPRFVRVRYDK
jgi:DNA ligase-1